MVGITTIDNFPLIHPYIREIQRSIIKSKPFASKVATLLDEMNDWKSALESDVITLLTGKYSSF